MNGINAQLTRSIANTKTKLEPIIKEGTEESDETKVKENQPWVDAIQGNRLFTKGLDIKYIASSTVDGRWKL